MTYLTIGRSICVTSFVVLSSVCAQAQGTKAVSWNGAWLSGKGMKPAIEVRIKDGVVGQLLVDGSPRDITNVEISPDQMTVLFSWESGQGTLLRLEDKAAEISLFGQKMNVRNAVIHRN